MSTDPKATPPSKPAPSHSAAATNMVTQRVRIFSYPKIVFMIPSMIVALICGIVMWGFGDRTEDPRHATSATQVTVSNVPGQPVEVSKTASTEAARPARRFLSVQNIVGVIFLAIFALNLLIMSIDFPRFTVIALVFFFAALGFFILWLNVYFELLEPLTNLLERIYTVANAGFYIMFSLVILVNLGVIMVTRYLDYWEILPNEILHNHGPFSDLERYPTAGVKLDKEIPDILEYALLRSGRLVLNIPNQPRSIVLDNVLWINTKEEKLKRVLSRMEVRVTSDRETDAEV